MDDGLPHAKDLRKGRVSLANQIYLLTTVTRDRVPVFRDLVCGRIVVQALRFHAVRGGVQSLAFVVMPDHLHWLIQLSAGQHLDRLMQSIKTYSARRVNAYLGRQERGVWQAGYHDHAVRCEEDVVGLARYVVANPLRAGLVERIADYPLWDAVWL